MQKITILFAFSVVLVQSVPLPQSPAVPQSRDAAAPIVKQQSEVNHDGSFKNTYETGNGIVVDEAGYQKPGNGEPIQVIQGSSAYTAPDGTVIQTQYVADENGYQPIGPHLPTPPPADPQIIKALEYLASLPSTPEPAYAQAAPSQ